MRRHVVTLLLVMGVLVASDAGRVWADFGTEITISDLNNDATAWHGDYEDEEVEPGMTDGQQWDLEGFYLDGTQLTMVGGFNFADGQWGDSHLWSAGDIFIDIDGDAAYGDIHDTTNDNEVVQNTFGYDYVLDLNFLDLTYDLYALDDESRTETAYYAENQGSSPWRYYDGGTLEGTGDVGYQTGLGDADLGLSGGYHNALTIDTPFLPWDTSDITVHFTYQSGADNLMGHHAVVPLPGAAILGLLGLSYSDWLIRRRRPEKRA